MLISKIANPRIKQIFKDLIFNLPPKFYPIIYETACQASKFIGKLQFAQGNHGIESSTANGISFYDNELNVKGDGVLYLGYRETTGVQISTQLNAISKVTVGGDLKAENNIHGGCYTLMVPMSGGSWFCSDGYYIVGIWKTELLNHEVTGLRCCRL